MVERLFVYGTLKPGEANAHELSSLSGTWEAGSVRGRFYASGRGAATGYPGVVLDEGGETVSGMLLSSGQLPAHWARLDEFEGEGYDRVLTRVTLEDGREVTAFIYELIHIPPES